VIKVSREVVARAPEIRLRDGGDPSEGGAKIVSGRKCQDFDILGVVAHRQQAEHREGVRDTEVCQAQQHGLHPRPAVTVDQMGCG